MQLLYLATLLLSITNINTASPNEEGASQSPNFNAQAATNSIIQALDQFNKFVKIAEKTNKAHTTWHAKADTRFDFSEDRIKALTSLKISDSEFDSMTSQNFEDTLQAAGDPLPENFSAADKWANCAASIMEVPDQSYCGSCWAVASATALTDRMCISTNGANRAKLSSQDLLECCPNCGYKCNGGSTVAAYNWALSAGITSGGAYLSSGNCKPYGFAPCSDPAWRTNPACTTRNTNVTCRNSCQASFLTPYPSDKKKIKKVYRVSGGEEAIKMEIFLNGPVTAAFTVFQDFMTYKTGVYQKRSGSQLGGHAIKMVGWGIENGIKYWLCVNSWNKYWGDRGYFKILRGVNHMQIESYIVAGTFN